MYKFSNSRSFRSARTSLGALLACALWTMSLAGVAQAAEGEAKPPAASAPATAPKTTATAPATTKTTAAPAPAGTKAAPAPAPAKATPATTAAPAPKTTAQAPAASTTAAPTDGSTTSGPNDAAREEARLAFEAGTKAFDEGNYPLAADQFRKAYTVIPSPHSEYWLALALDKSDPENKEPATVVDAYAQFLSNPGASHVEPERVAAAQARLLELKKMLPASISLATTPAGAAVVVDGELEAGITPLTLKLPAGSHKVEISMDGYESALIELNVEGGSTVQQEVELKKLPPPPAPVDEAAPVTAPPAKRSIVPAAVTLGLGGAGLISGTLFGIMAIGAKKDFNDDPTTENADTAERNALIADMSFGIALTLGITGIVLLTAEEEEAPATARKGRLQVAPFASKRGGGIAGLLTF